MYRAMFCLLLLVDYLDFSILGIQLLTTAPKHPPVLVLDIIDNSYSPKSFCNITFDRSVANVTGKSSGIRITSIDRERVNMISSSSSSKSSSAQRMLKIGDELVFINDIEIKPSRSPEDVAQILNDAAPSSSSSVRLVVIRTTDTSYRKNAVLQRFQNNYDNITWESNSRVTLTPENNTSLLQATLFPLWKTRFKYEIRFENSTGKVSYEDLYKITFNRSNGASPEQQLRIQKSWNTFEEKVHELKAQMEFDLELARTSALELNQRRKNQSGDVT